MSEPVWLSGLVIVVVLILLAKVILTPLQVIKNLVAKSGLGILLIFLFNYIGSLVAFTLPFNPITVLTAGFLGIPGIILLAYLRYIAH